MNSKSISLEFLFDLGIKWLKQLGTYSISSGKILSKSRFARGVRPDRNGSSLTR
jgi:hypothetical protein